MKTLCLLRHAEALPAAGPTGADDHARALSDAGRADCATAAAFLRARSLSPGLILSSDSRRTAETAELIARALGMPGERLQMDRRLYLATALQLIDTIRAAPPAEDSLCLVAHNPGIADAALYFSDGAYDKLRGVPPATLAVFHLNAESWQDIDPGLMMLEDVFMPSA